MAKKIEMGDMLSESVLEFARYTITDRHFVHIEDGLKPSQRRILYAMYESGLKPNRYRAKTFDILGSVTNYSPHGTQTLDGAMARLTNDTSLYPLIDGKGSFSSITSRDVQHASSRYTEGRLSRIAEELFSDIDKNAIDFIDNYNEQRKEPKVLPSRFPHVLTSADNGMGMGISMRTASFNLADVVDNTIRVLTNKPTEIMYPDFQTKGQVVKDDVEAEKVKNAGKGKFTLRGTYEVSDDGRHIYIHEIPYTATRENIIDKVIKMVKSGELPDVVDINDMTSSSGMEIEIIVKKNTDIEQLMAKIYKKTEMELNYHCDYWVIYNNKPYHLGTDDILRKWLQFRAKTVKRVKEFELKGNQDKLHILYGLEKVLLDIDKTIKIIKQSDDDGIIPSLKQAFDLDDKQAQVIANTRLRNLSHTYIEDKTKEIEKLEDECERLETIIGSRKEIAKIIIRELSEIKEKYAQPRLTQIVDKEEIVDFVPQAEQIEDYNLKLFITKENYVKKIPLTSLRGDFEIKTKTSDEIIDIFETTNTAELLVFTDQHNVYKKRLCELSDDKPSTLGAYMPGELGLKDENILYICVLDDDSKWLLVGYEDGRLAKIELDAYETKTNRTMLKNAYGKQKPVFMASVAEDKDILVQSTDTRTVLINTSVVSPKKSKTSQGNKVINLKPDCHTEYIELVGDTEELEYYRVKNTGVGYLWKGE